MNKHCYRILFNKARGMRMVVAESATSLGKATGETSGNAVVKPTSPGLVGTLRPVAFSLMLAWGAVAMLPIAAQAAGVVADSTAPKAQQPVILNAGNGVPVVNIQTPSAAGVSRNTYSQFDVNSNGAILNNSRNNVSTQLGGYIQGNPYLATGTARVILNEVNSANPSYLNGYVEVAGSRAQVVIANPSGISCNGCGFINASRATLTTGTPLINAGSLTGYVVGGGLIEFLGAGLDTSTANYTDVISRAVNVNAGIYAQTLNIATGVGQVNVDADGNHAGIAAAAASTGSPAFSIDVAALGGMYAGKITLIGTEAGVGVRNAGNIGASAGEFTLTNDGLLINTGKIASTTQTTIHAQGITNTDGEINAGQQLNITANSITGDGKLLSAGDATINLTSHYTQQSTGQLQANTNLSLSTTADITNQGQLLAGNILTLNAQNINNTVTSEISGSSTLINATGSLTNRGLMDGSDTFISANKLNNIGTGTILGDHIAIAAHTLLNDTETVSGVTHAATIAARNRLDIGASTITNREHSLLFSAGDMAIGSALDANHQATGQAATLNNNSATIEALGNLDLNVAQINNTNEHFSTADVIVSSQSFDELGGQGSGVRYAAPAVGIVPSLPGCGGDCFDVYTTPAPNSNAYAASVRDVLYQWYLGGVPYRNTNRYVYTRTVSETQVASSDPGSIQSAGNLNIAANTLLNDNSKIVAGGSLGGSVGTLTNTAAAGNHTSTDSGTAYFYITHDPSGGGNDYTEIQATAYAPAPTVQNISLTPTLYQANTTPTGTNTTLAAHAAVVPNSSLFTTNPSANANYLIETNPRFANYRTWLSSDYLLNALNYDPATTQQRLGDGFYEQKLVREQIGQLTGRRFLEGYANDEAQYQALMNAGVTEAHALQLIPGVTLTATQLAQLTSDIVWLVEQTVTLPDGSSQQVLSPQVYVKLQANDLNPSTGMMTGNTVNLNISNDINNSGTLTNTGTIAGRQVLTINAANINNLGGQLAGDTVQLNASHDLNNSGGSITAADQLNLNAGHDLNVVSTTSTQTNQQGSTTNINRVAGLYVTNANGILVASAGNDINLLAAAINNGNTTNTSNTNNNDVTLIQAGHDINLGTVKQSQRENLDWNSKNYRHDHTQSDAGTVIQTQGKLNVVAGHDISTQATDLTSSQGAMTLQAGHDVSIGTGSQTEQRQEASYFKGRGGWGKKTEETTKLSSDQSNSNSSSLSANSININAGHDIAVTGSNVVSDQGTTLNAGNNTNITAAQNTDHATNSRERKQSGFSFSSSSIGYSKSKLNTNSDTQTNTNIASTVGSINGDVNLNAGKTYTQTGSDVLAPKGDINITAQNVTIQAATDTYQRTDKMSYKQTGITLAITSPVISAIQTASQMANAASQTKDGRMQALAAATTALSVKNAYDATNTALSAKPSGSSVTDAANQVGGFNISLSIGTSKSSSTSTQTNNNASSSHVTAGNNIHITATGDKTAEGVSKPDTGNLNVIGSEIKAAHNVNLSGDNNLNLQAAQNTHKLDSSNKNSSASLGVSFGSDGLLFTAGLSGGKGFDKGNGTTYTETVIQGGNHAGDKATLNSGHDTNLIGAQVAGKQVIANVGTSGSGNLNIQSLQDTDQYSAKQQSIGGSVSIGYGKMGGSFNYSDSKTKSNYASVNEQAGIFTGDGGFQVNIKGNTNLTGAVLASTQTAIDHQQNSLTTQTLTVSNIENKAAYEAGAMSVSVGAGTQGGKPTITGAGVGLDSEKANSTTVSAISVGTLNIINDSDPSKIALSRDVHVGMDTNGNPIAVNSQGNNLAATVKPIFDAEKVAKEIQAQVQITQAFGQQANQAVGNYVQSTRTSLQAQLKNASTDAEKAAIQSQLGDLTTQERVMNVLIGAVTGTGGAALTKEGLSVAADQMRQITIESSKKFLSVTDGTTELSNMSGNSEGVRGDGVKAGGTRVDLDKLCGPSNERCKTNTDGSLALNDRGQVQWDLEKNKNMTLATFLETDQGKKMYGTTGGIQGWKGTLFGIPYEAWSWQDKLIESFGGTHDVIGGQLSGLYDEQGNATRGRSEVVQIAQDVWSASGAIVLSSPFAAAELLPPAVWQAISVLLKGAQ
jgi:filamentous hemagglutinin